MVISIGIFDETGFLLGFLNGIVYDDQLSLLGQ